MVQRIFLRHPTRRAIVQALAREPGLNKRQLAARVGVHPNMVDHHVGRLVDVELVATRRTEGGMEVHCFLIRDLHLWDAPATRVLFGGAGLSRVASCVATHPGAYARDLARMAGMTTPAVYHHLATLVRNRLVHRWRVGNRYHHFPTRALEWWAREMAARRQGPTRDRQA